MAILILGAQGNLGAQLVSVFGSEAIAWDREDLDITDRDKVLEKISGLKPEVIINATAYNAVDKCESDPAELDLAKKLNGAAVGYLAEAALVTGAILIHYSTDYVFNGEADGYREEAIPNPINNYGRTKLLGEQELSKKSVQGLKYYLIRTSKLFGPKGPAAVSKPSFFDLMLGLSKDREELKAVDEELSCFTYTADLASATKDLLEKGYPYGIYHIVNSHPATWYEAVSSLFAIAGINVKLVAVKGVDFPRPAQRPKCSVLINTKFPPLRDYQVALREYLKLN